MDFTNTPRCYERVDHVVEKELSILRYGVIKGKVTRQMKGLVTSYEKCDFTQLRGFLDPFDPFKIWV